MNESKKLENWAKRISTGCLKKAKYNTEAKARRKAQQIFEEKGLQLHCYYCPHCGYFHLTRNSLDNWGRKVF